MRNLFKQTIGRVKQILHPADSSRNKNEQEASISDLLAETENNDQEWKILLVFDKLLHNRNEESLEALQKFDARLRKMPLVELAYFEEYFRKAFFYLSFNDGWQKIEPEDLEDLSYYKECQVSILGICSFHPSGYVREKALTKLGEISTGEEVPYLLIRLSDWVPQVRSVADLAVKERLKPEYADQFIACIPLIAKLKNQNRFIHSPIILSIDELLKSIHSRNALLNGLEAEDDTIRRKCYQLAFEAEEIDLFEVINLGVDDSDNLIRQWCAQKTQELPDDNQASIFLERFWADHFVPARRAALHVLVDRYPEKAVVVLERGLLDAHASIRQETRFFVNKRMKMDFASFYRKALKEGEKTYAAISGLGETGTESDDKLILPFINNSVRKNRRAAVKALAKLNPSGNIEAFFLALTDSSPAVSLEAYKALTRQSGAVNGKRVWDVFENASDNHVKVNTIKLMAGLSKWESIYYFLKAASVADDAISESAYIQIDNWINHFNSSFTHATTAQIEELKKQLTETRNHSDHPLLNRLDFYFNN